MKAKSITAIGKILKEKEETAEKERSMPSPTEEPDVSEEDEEAEVTYILNKNTKKFHYPDCPSVNTIKEKNKVVFYGTREEAIKMGYSPCGRCNP